MTQASLIKDSSKLIASSLRDPMRQLISDQLGPVRNTLNSLSNHVFEAKHQMANMANDIRENSNVQRKRSRDQTEL